MAMARKGFDPGIMMARVSLAPYTWSESTRMLEPIGVDRWPRELALKYGMHDGFTCPVGGRWVVTFWSPLMLAMGLSTEARAALFMGASFAAMRLEKLVDLDPARIGKRARLTARELAVLRWASFGRQVREIGHELGLSAETVRSHLKKAQAKLGAHNRTHAVIRGFAPAALTLSDGSRGRRAEKRAADLSAARGCQGRRPDGGGPSGNALRGKGVLQR